MRGVSSSLPHGSSWLLSSLCSGLKEDPTFFDTTHSIRKFGSGREKQEAQLVPLTLLVGDNSTGKTPFLTIVRAFWEFAYCGRTPDFKEDPYDLGIFEDIAHYRGRERGASPTPSRSTRKRSRLPSLICLVQTTLTYWRRRKPVVPV